MNLQNSAFLALLVGGIGYIVYGQMNDGNTIKELASAAIAALGGAGGLLYNNVDKLKGMMTSKKKKNRFSFTPKDYEIEDLKCLVHIRGRFTAAKDKEGVFLCEQINTKLFELNTDKVDDGGEVITK